MNLGPMGREELHFIVTPTAGGGRISARGKFGSPAVAPTATQIEEDTNERRPSCFAMWSELRLLVPLILVAYGAWAIYSAAASGMLRWGALGDYSLFSYVLLLGLVSSGVVLARTRSRQVGGLSFLLFLAFGSALGTMRPVTEIPASMR